MVMIEPNPVNLKQDISFPGVSKKLQTCLRATHRQEGKTGKEPEQMIPFACVMGNACHTTTQKTGKIPLNFRPDKGKMCGPFKKGKGLVKSPHRAIPESEATKNINAVGLFATARNNKGGFPRLFTDASNGKGAKTNGSIPGKINLLPKRDGEKQSKGKLENLPGSTGLKKSKAGINNVLIEDVRGALKPGLNRQSIESVLPKSWLTGMVVGKDEIRGQRSEVRGQRGWHGQTRLSVKDEVFKESRGARVADPVGENFRDGKSATDLFRDSGFKESGSGINNALVRGRKAGVRGQRAEMVDALGLLKFNLKNAVAVKGKSAVEPDKTEKNSFTLVKSGGRNDIGNSLKHLGLNVEEAAAWHKKTGVKEFPDHKIEIFHKGIPRPERSSDRGFSAGGYHNATFHASGRSSAVNESVNSHGIEPRALINQIASGVKRPGRVRITLNPPRLGTLDVDVLVRDNKVHVMLQPENNDVRQILQSNVESLKSSLRNQGLVADTINVSVQEKSDGANHGSGQSETLFKEGGNRKGNEEDQGREQNSLNHNPSSFEEENQLVRSDGRISLFV